MSGFHKAKQLFWPNPLSSLHMVGMLLCSLLYMAPSSSVVFLQFDFTKNVVITVHKSHSEYLCNHEQVHFLLKSGQ